MREKGEVIKIKLDEVLKKQARGETLTAEEEKFLLSVTENENKDVEVETKKGKEKEKDTVFKDLETLREELEKIKKEKELREEELKTERENSKLKEDLLKEKELKEKELLEAFKKTKEEQDSIVKKIEEEKTKQEQNNFLKELLKKEKEEAKTKQEELMKELEEIKLSTEISNMKLVLKERMDKEPYLKTYLDKLYNSLESDNKKDALRKYKALNDSFSELIDIEEEKKRYELSKKKSESIFDDINLGGKVNKNKNYDEKLDELSIKKAWAIKKNYKVNNISR